MTDVPGYPARLRLDHPGPPSVEGLRLLHRAQVERVAYENLEIQLGRMLSIEPAGSFAGMDFRSEEAGVGDFLERHRWLSTAPESGFVRVACVQRRDAAHAAWLASR
jgi:arylamine N-acetyltransferase